jgi:hypothetical protein
MINVNTVYKSVLSILNKEQRGYLTPDEFNKIAKQAQLNLLEISFAEYNRFLSMDTLGRINAGYADLPEKTKEKIEVFYKTSNLPNGNTLPSDVFKLIDLNMLNKTVSLEEIDKNELSYILSSPLTKPSKDFPVYYKTTTNLGLTSIVVEPSTTDTISIDYIKIPTEPRFGYSVNATYGTNIYDSNAYVADGLVVANNVLTTRTTIASGATNGTYTGTAGTTSGFTGGNATIRVTVAGNAVTQVDVTAAGSGYSIGDTITVASSVIGGSTNLVITIGANDLYSGNTTLGSTNFELHPSEESTIIMTILGMAGVVIKSTDITTLVGRAMQNQAAIKAQ